MGFFKNFFGIKDNTDQSDSNKILFVTKDEERSFENSIYGQLQIYDAELDYIAEVLPEAGDSLKKQVELLTKLIEVKNNETDFEIIQCFENFKNEYEESKRRAEGEYTIRELETQNKLMDRSFETSLDNGGITKKDLDSYINYISMIQEKVKSSESSGNPILTSVQRHKFNNISLKSEYRLKMLELMYLMRYGEIESNPFRNLSVTKQKIFSKLFWQDAQLAAKQYDYLSYYENLFNQYDSRYFYSIDAIAKRLNEEIRNARMLEDFSIRQLFDSTMSDTKSFEFLKDFISFKTTLNEMKDKKQIYQESKDRDDENKRLQEEQRELNRKQAEDQARLNQEKEQAKLDALRNMTNSEICQKIDEINSDLTAKGNRFINIYEFQKEIAKARGLIDSDIDIRNRQLYYHDVGPVTLIKILKKANEKGVNYIVYPNCQETDTLFTFVVSKSDKDITEVEQNDSTSIPINRYSYAHNSEQLGNFDILTLKMIGSKLQDSDIQYLVANSNNNNLYTLQIGNHYGSSEDVPYKSRRKILEVIQEVRSELKGIASSDAEIQNILCYLQLPVISNMIPLLEKLKAADVEVLLEPVPNSNRNDKNRENVHIYFKRDDLEKVSQVLQEVPERGVISIKQDRNIIGKSIIDRAIWPDSREK